MPPWGWPAGRTAQRPALQAFVPEVVGHPWPGDFSPESKTNFQEEQGFIDINYSTKPLCRASSDRVGMCHDTPSFHSEEGDSKNPGGRIPKMAAGGFSPDDRGFDHPT